MLFIILVFGFLIYSIFAKDWLINCIKNKKGKISENIGVWLFINIINDLIFGGIIFIISAVIVAFSPYESYSYSFNINSLNDNLVTSGNFYGRMYSVRGSIDGEISYFFSRDTNLGETIGHIPSSKTYIHYDNEIEPYIEVHKKRPVIPEWTKKVFWTNLNVFNQEPTAEYYILVIPEGTISIEGVYQIDLE